MESLTPNRSNPALKVKKKKKKEEEEEREVEKNLEMLKNKYFGQGLLPYNLFFKQE